MNNPIIRRLASYVGTGMSLCLLNEMSAAVPLIWNSAEKRYVKILSADYHGVTDILMSQTDQFVEGITFFNLDCMEANQQLFLAEKLVKILPKKCVIYTASDMKKVTSELKVCKIDFSFSLSEPTTFSEEVLNF